MIDTPLTRGDRRSDHLPSSKASRPVAPTRQLAGRRNSSGVVPTKAAEQQSSQPLIIAIGVLTMAYNGLLAALLALGVPINGSVPAVFEVLLLLTSAIICFKDGFSKSSIFPLALIYFVIMSAVVISINSDTIYLVAMRNFLIISVFTILGGQCNFKTLRNLFLCCSILAVLTLILEVGSLDSYVKVFEPARYLSVTRGMAQSEYSGGLSAGTINYDGRFTLGLYSGPRTSSIFLEQVSINCFAIVLALFLTVFWSNLKKSEIAIHTSAIFAILATNNARMALILSIVYAIGYPLFSRLPKYTNVFVIPGIIAGLFTVFLFITPVGGDDLVGRMATTYALLTSMNLGDLVLGNLSKTGRALDSGYGFLIFSTSVFGLIVYWLYISFIIPQVDARSKRSAWGLGVYIGVWLLVGGTGTFSMKTAPLLWLVVGFVRRQSLGHQEEAAAKARRRSL
ncbi:MAG: hypothetical protein EOO61_09065 [Hymenobacter sp.]|nr:MAG: hypothetical protein EOO61_09065 [Hymenobacter sp.]